MDIYMEGSNGSHSLSIEITSNRRSVSAMGNYPDYENTGSPQSYSEWKLGVESKKKTKPGKLSDLLDLHLYILTQHSSIFRFLRHAWNSILITSTMEIVSCNNNSVRNGLKQDRNDQILESLERQLQGIKDKNLSRAKSRLEFIAKEFEASSAAKKMFWNSTTLYSRLIGKLNYLLSVQDKQSQQSVECSMEKLGLSVILLKINLEVLQNFENASSRRRHLADNKTSTKTMIKSIVSFPNIPNQCKEVVLKILISHGKLKNPDWEVLEEANLIRTILEITNLGASALYNILEIASQSGEKISDPDSFSQIWIINIITGVEGWELFLDRLMSHILALITSPLYDLISPPESVLLHQKMSIIHLMIYKSQLCHLYFKMNYVDEMKYLVSGKIIGHKIPTDYPIRRSLLKLVEDLRKNVILGEIPSPLALHMANV